MHFYGLGYGELRSIPVVTFWELSKNVNRIRADEDRRQVALLQNSVFGNPAKYLNALNKEHGEVVRADYENSNGFDKEGFNRLRLLMGARR